MSDAPIGQPAGHLLYNLMHFARALRAAGLRVGPGDVLAAARAVEVVTIERRDDLHAALAAVFVKRRQDREVFDEAFYIFWRKPGPDAPLHVAAAASAKVPAGEDPETQMRRLKEMLGPQRKPGEAEGDPPEEIETEIALHWSDREKLASAISSR